MSRIYIAEQQWLVLVPQKLAVQRPLIGSESAPHRLNQRELASAFKEVRELGIATDHWM